MTFNESFLPFGNLSVHKCYNVNKTFCPLRNGTNHTICNNPCGNPLLYGVSASDSVYEQTKILKNSPMLIDCSFM